MGCLPPHEEVTAPWKDNRQTPRGDTAWCEVCRMAEVPSGGVFGTPWQVFGTLAPAKSKWPLELFQGPFAANSTGALLLEN